MNQHLHDVLHDIASDVPQTDLVAGVAARATRIRWMRRGVLGGTVLGVAAMVGLVTVVLPSWQQTTRPDDDIPFSKPTEAPALAPEIDLDGAATGTLPVVSGLVVVLDADGTLRTVAIDAERGDAVAVDAAAPADLQSVQLSPDGTHALLVGSSRAVAIDVSTGATLAEVPRVKDQPVTLSWDGRSVITFARDPALDPASSGATAPWQLTSIDLETAAVTQLGEPLERSSAAGEIFAAPDGETIFVRYDGSVLDYRLHRLDLATGATLFTESYNALKTSSMHWPSDGSVLAAETTSAVRILTPSDTIGDHISSLSKLGVPLGFAGAKHLVWWRGGTGEELLVLSDLAGNELQGTTTLATEGTVVAIATALG